MSCILADKEFLIYVAENINGEHAFLSDVATLINHFLYEKGKRCKAKLDKGEAEDQKALAKCLPQWGASKWCIESSRFATGVTASLPKCERFSRPTIVKLHKQFSGPTDDQQQSLLTKCDASEGFVWQRSEAQGNNSFN